MIDPGKVIILGADGQVGRQLKFALAESAIPLSRNEIDLVHDPRPALDRVVKESGVPAALINAAAYTQVDQAEHERELAMQVNGIAPGLLADWCFENAIPFVHFSTDYVFAGTGNQEWSETDPTGPLNFYGVSKLEGENSILARATAQSAVDPGYLIFRTSWVFDSQGRNFVRSMLRLGIEQDKLRIVSDQIGSPTYARHLAVGVVRALRGALSREAFPSGIYHLRQLGTASWKELAEAVFSGARARGTTLQVKEIEGIRSDQYVTAARRPLNSRLSVEKFFKTFGFNLAPWQEAVEECLDQIL